uniref:O-methyltransferase pyiA n=1 Tax=Pyricularia grisea TaxID=148305 RepID=PYIA_PYRGI|nr:RecName: Full=O-methyltransferase pyiA; AltName: Full=Pyrichalasin H biosynthesis cluster protein A [Pyricularia grisea]QCS37511.1 PyiA [Pyricularia grisea]
MASQDGTTELLSQSVNSTCIPGSTYHVDRGRASSASTPPTSPPLSEVDYTPLLESTQEPRHEYTQLAHSLVKAMADYVGHLQEENLPMPSLEPAAQVHGGLKVQGGVAARDTVVKLAQKIVAMTMDPEMKLFISSLQFHFCSSLKVAIDLRVHELDECFRASSRQADALALARYREPHEADTLGFGLAFNTTANFWEVLARDTEGKRSQRFNRAMRAVNINALEVIPRIYPFNRIGGNGLLVDVGGGLGQVARAIMATNQGSRLQRCIVQDVCAADDVLEEVLESNRKLGVELQRHDFFDKQPVTGASIYFFRHIFHDWPDRACVKILKQIVQAMGRDSRLLICDQVVDDEPSIPATLYDIDMWTLFGGKERNRSEWEALFRAADERLYIKKVWTTTEAPTTILEVCLW